MALIEWRDELTTGVASVDHELAELVRLINEAHARMTNEAPAVEIEEFLGEVYARIGAHFALEEAVMRSQRTMSSRHIRRITSASWMS